MSTNITPKAKRVKMGMADRIMYAVFYTLLTLLLIIIAYPLIYVVSSSFSSGAAVSAGKVVLWPVEFSLQGYKMVFNYKQIWVGYANTLFYTIVGVSLSLILTTCAAYPLARRNFQGRGFYTTIFLITMFFGGGLIPTYLLNSQLGLVNTRWAIIFSGTVSVYNMTIMRTFFQNSIPDELHEAAKIDGINDFGYLFKIVLPLSRAIYAVITLYYAVARWNTYFDAMIYLRDDSKHPLQMVLRNVLNAGNVDLSQITDSELLAAMTGSKDLMQYAMIVMTSLPVMVAYPFVQKFFDKGVMIGSVKG